MSRNAKFRLYFCLKVSPPFTPLSSILLTFFYLCVFFSTPILAILLLLTCFYCNDGNIKTKDCVSVSDDFSNGFVGIGCEDDYLAMALHRSTKAQSWFDVRRRVMFAVCRWRSPVCSFLSYYYYSLFLASFVFNVWVCLWVKHVNIRTLINRGHNFYFRVKHCCCFYRKPI